MDIKYDILVYHECHEGHEGHAGNEGHGGLEGYDTWHIFATFGRALPPVSHFLSFLIMKCL